MGGAAIDVRRMTVTCTAAAVPIVNGQGQHVQAARGPGRAVFKVNRKRSDALLQNKGVVDMALDVGGGQGS
jgi:hypothetical protein